MKRIVKILLFLIVLILIFNKFIISQVALYSFSKWANREVQFDTFKIDYINSKIAIDNLKIKNPENFYYKNVVELKNVTIKYNLKSLLSDLVVINSLIIENLIFYIEIIKENDENSISEEAKDTYIDNIDAVEKIMKKKPRKVYPKKKKDKNFIIGTVKINEIKTFIKTSFLKEESEVNIYDLEYKRVGNGGSRYFGYDYLHHKIALKEIASQVIEKISNIKLRKLIKEIYDYKNLYKY
tara:strand:+ start:1221 stop:1937 length:717 start_codon:yes stop_codon:yes gene_type:complete